MDKIDAVYYSLLGQLQTEATLPWVENAFVEGSECYAALLNAYDARDRLLERLQTDGDTDLECIIDSFIAIQYILCRKMYLYGLQQQ